MALQDRISSGEALVLGIAGWLALNVFLRAAAPLFGLSFAVTANFFGSFLLPRAGGKVQMAMGMALYLAAVVGWSFAYRQLRPRLPGTGWVQGLLFGTGAWFVIALLLPVLGWLHPAGVQRIFLGPGPLGLPYPGFLSLGFAGVSGLALALLAHQVLGITLALVTDVMERIA